MPYIDGISVTKDEANVFLSRKLLKNSWHHFEETQQGNLDRECIQEICVWEEAREVFETDVDSLNAFWAQYTGQTSASSQDNAVGLILGILFGVVGLIIIIILIYVLWKRTKGDLDKKMMQNAQPYTPYPFLSFYASKKEPRESNNYESPLLDTFDNELAMGLSQCYIERERLQLGEVMTSGNFGDVWEGRLKQRDNTIVNVAVKSLKNLSDPDDIEKFLREGVMMHGLDHKHVLGLFGVCVDTDVQQCRSSPLIVLPFMKNGDLRSFLRDGNNILTVLHLLKFCHQVALGMEYLAEKKFVHRDLAARNCMVNEHWLVKVADFGLSRDIYDRDYYRSSVKTQLPLKWMSPESIQYGRYDEKTDVWSYGIVCWEILTRGAIPYPTIQTVAILEYITEGKRMGRPECCPHKLHKIMEKCWDEDPEHRPTFQELVVSTNSILRDAKRSIKRKKQSSDAAATASGKIKQAHPYQNSMKDAQGEEQSVQIRPKPKPRTSLKRSADQRTDKYKPKDANTEQYVDKSADSTEPSCLDSTQPLSITVTDLEVGEYNDTDHHGRTTSV